MEVPFLSFEDSNKQIRSQVLAAFEAFYDGQQYIMGQKLQKFEEQFASFCNSNYCVGTGNGMDALYLALKALGIKKGDEVIVPALTFAATGLAVIHTGATPIFVDVIPETGNISPSQVKNAITSKTKAVIPVHLYGHPCQISEIMEIASTQGLFVVEDNAQAQGATFNRKRTGSFGHLSATSFYPTKNLGALGDAGAITTNDQTLYEKCLRLRNYGSSDKYIHDTFGTNSRLDELQAAILNIKLEYLERWNEERRTIARWYLERLSSLVQIKLPVEQEGYQHVYHLFTIQTEKRDELQTFLHQKGIGTLIHYPVPMHLQKVFADLSRNKKSFPVAERIAKTTLSLPIYIGLSETEVDYACQQIHQFFTS
ncbi:DegT/DnrJ/EryC1/StrS family aminotransferase [Limibacter armeniacum]|uniref:DegT/DnrJ/EryC1/StrS family aminotransferase n=1 Tax=Limibacter armeniacum TaxID=466084 RepID=UPI002FE56A23